MRRRGETVFGLLAMMVTWMATASAGPSGGAQGREAEAARVLAIVNDDTIRAGDVDELLIRTHQTVSHGEKESFDYRKLLTKLIHDRLLAREAESIGLDEEPAVQAAIEEERRRQSIRQYVAATYVAPEPVAEEEAVRFFEEYYWKLQIRQISVPTREEASSLLDAIRSGASMDSLARQRSGDFWSARGGLHRLGFWADVEVPIRQAAIGLETGELSEPFPYGNLVSIVRMESRSAPDTADYRMVRGKVVAYLQSSAREKSWREFLEARKRAVSLEVDRDVLAAIAADSDAVLTGEFLRPAPRAALVIAGCDTVTEETLRRAVSHAAMTEGTAPFDTLLERGLTEKSEELALYCSAAAAGFENDPKVQEQVAQKREQALIDLYLKEMIVPEIAFRQEEFRSYYDEHREDFRGPDEIQLATILLPTKEEAEATIERLDRGADFAFLKQKAEAESGDPIGEQGWLGLGSLPPSMAEKLGPLPIGGVGGPFQVDDGWLLAKVKDRRPGRVQTLEEADGEIRRTIFQKQFNEILDRHLEALKAASTIVLDEEAIEQYFGSGS